MWGHRGERGAGGSDAVEAEPAGDDLGAYLTSHREPAQERPEDIVLDDEDWAEEPERGVFGFGVVVASLVAVMLGAGAWLFLQIPPATALAAPTIGIAPAALDAASGVVAEQLAGAAGRSLDAVAAQVAAVAVPTAEDPETVAGESAASTDYADTLAALAEAERAAAQQLAISEQDAAAAKAEQARAQQELASEEAAAAREIDNAVAAAIAAAEAQTTADGAIATAAPDAGATGTGSVQDPTAAVPAPTEEPDTSGGTVPGNGAPIDTAGVLALVRKYFPAEEVTNAMAVSRCESGHRNAVGARNGNGTRDFGIFQINDGGTLQAALRRIDEPYSGITQARQKALDAELNVRMARVLWDSRGWQPWVCAAKTKVVSGLYQRTPGPMYGRYNEAGQAS